MTNATSGADVRAIAAGPRSEFFVGSRTMVDAAYADANGARLRGTAPLTVTSSDPSAEASVFGARIFVGTSPHTLTVRSEAAPQELLIEVVDDSAITGVDGVTDERGAIGEPRCLTPMPSFGQTAIGGESDARPVVSFGDAAHVVELVSLPDELCLVGARPGQTDLSARPGARTRASATAR